MRSGAHAHITAKCSKLTQGKIVERKCIAVGDAKALPLCKPDRDAKKSIVRIIKAMLKKAAAAKKSFLIFTEKYSHKAACLLKTVFDAAATAAAKLKSYFDILMEADKNKISVNKKRRLAHLGKKWEDVCNSFKIFGRQAKTKTAKHLRSVRRFTTRQEHRPILAMGGTCMAIVIGMFILASRYSIGFEAVVNGQSVGVVKSEEECVEVVNEVNNVLSEHFDSSAGIQADITTVPRLIPKDQYTPESELKTAICQLTDKMQQMCVVYLDGEALFGLPDEQAAQTVMTNFRNYYTKGKENVTFSTEKPLEVKNELAPATLLRDAETAVNILNGSEKKDHDYIVQPGDTLWSIAEKYDTNVGELLALNEGLTENIMIGDVITVKAYIPIVKVTTTERAEYVESIPYETEVIETADMYRGKTQIKQEGVNGQANVVATIIKENGREVRRDIESREVISNPVNCVKLVGTKTPPSGYGTGKFIAPTTGTVTSRFGYRRGGFHKGIDIANSYGTPIRAADNGRVTFAGWKGLFGRLVILNHGNGYVTYYAHNSRIAVKVGETVKKGDVIAYMGSTGNSTGSHCHFEIHYNGVVKNPSNYIGL